jgi:ABC-type sugar transport system permease subunit
MEFGYAAALSLIMTASLLLVIIAYVRRQAREL